MKFIHIILLSILLIFYMRSSGYADPVRAVIDNPGPNPSHTNLDKMLPNGQFDISNGIMQEYLSIVTKYPDLTDSEGNVPDIQDTLIQLWRDMLIASDAVYNSTIGNLSSTISLFYKSKSRFDMAKSEFLDYLNTNNTPLLFYSDIRPSLPILNPAHQWPGINLSDKTK